MNSVSVLEDYLVEGNQIPLLFSREEFFKLLPSKIDKELANNLYNQLKYDRQQRLDKISAHISENFDVFKASNSGELTSIAKDAVESVVSKLQRAKEVVDAQVSVMLGEINHELALLRELAERVDSNGVSADAKAKLDQALISLENVLIDTKSDSHENSNG